MRVSDPHPEHVVQPEHDVHDGPLLLPEHRATAARYFEEAAMLRQGLLEEEPGNLAAQAALMRAFACQGRCAEAVRIAEGLRQKAPQNVEYLVQIAGCYGRCAATAQGPDRQAFTAKALAALREAVRRDYRDAVAVRTDPDLEALRQNAEFRDLVAKLEAR